MTAYEPMKTIDEIKIEGEEDGFHLAIYTDDGETHRYRIGLPDQFRAEVRRTIGAWLAEGENARTYMPDDSGGYSLTDPKSPSWHDRIASLYDNREGK